MAFLDPSIDEEIDRLSGEIFPTLVEFRKQLHRHPELAFQEFRTTETIANQLQNWGISPNREAFETGLTVELTSGSADESTPLVCLRADIDAVENDDEKEVDYRSQNAGAMHGCGHDVHSSVLLGTMWSLNQLATTKPDFPFRVRGIFQPAEEVARGAEYMIERGADRGSSSIFAIHVDPRLDCGSVAIADGMITAICDEIEIELEGKSGHAARPFETQDPIQAAAMLINALYVNVPRDTDARHGVVITIGQINGGNAGNVIPKTVKLAGTLRSHCEIQRKLAVEAIQRTCRGISEACATKITPKFGKWLPAVNNSSALLPMVEDVCHSTLGKENVKPIELPSLGGEDFAYFATEEKHGFLIRVGSSSSDLGYPALHCSTFDVEPEVIGIGTRIMSKCALAASKSPPK